jgi:hypothetical protein
VLTPVSNSYTGSRVHPVRTRGISMIFDDRGLPWTIRLSLGWTIILALFSAGLLAVPLGLYLAYWVRTRQGRSAAFWCYLVVGVISILGLVVPKTFDLYVDPIASIGFIVFMAASFVLRAEIISLYQRSWGISLPINRLLTFFFSSVYLNYSVPDLPVAPSTDLTPRESKPASTVP